MADIDDLDALINQLEGECAVNEKPPQSPAPPQQQPSQQQQQQQPRYEAQAQLHSPSQTSSEPSKDALFAEIDDIIGQLEGDDTAEPRKPAPSSSRYKVPQAPLPASTGNTNDPHSSSSPSPSASYAPPPSQSSSHASSPSPVPPSAAPSKTFKNQKVCADCNQIIRGEFVNASERFYHPAHFKCVICKSSLQNQQFFERESKPHCSACYKRAFLNPCSRCKQPIDGNMMQALNKKFHPQCFLCSNCGKSFPNGEFFPQDGEAVCGSCIGQKTSTFCAACGQGVTGNIISALGQHWHPEHFVCQVCQKQFGTGPFYQGKDGQPYCEQHVSIGGGSSAGGGDQQQQTVNRKACASCKEPISGHYVSAVNRFYHPQHFVCIRCKKGAVYCEGCMQEQARTIQGRS